MASADPVKRLLRIELVWSPQAGDVRQAWLSVAEGSSIEPALRACPDFADQLSRLAELKVGIWGRIRALETALQERDRIEVYRPLTVDPMEGRRRRFEARGQRIVSKHRPLAGKLKR